MLKKIAVVLVIALVAILLSVKDQVSRFESLTLKNMPAQFEVAKGTGLNRLCQQWLKAQAIESCWQVQLYGKLYPQKVTLQSGLYNLQNLTVIDALSTISEGKQIQFSFTIIEGETLKMVLDKIQTAPYLTNDIDAASLAQTLSIDSSAEGWLLPETYFYTANSSALSIIKRAHEKMQVTLSAAWESRAEPLPLNNPYEVLILASIIEKETGYAGERAKIASVFVNRLNKKMRLQTDPTVIYGLGERFDGDIKRRDLREYTPYNTYRIKGLPPTPIAMPSKDAIIAATQPLTTEYYYFVAKGDGQHQFSKNLSAHNKAVKKYILKR